MTEKKEKSYSKPTGKPAAHEAEDNKNIRGIVRIAGKDLNGRIKLKDSFRNVVGIGTNLAMSISVVIEKELSIPTTTLIGELSDEQIEKIDKILFNLSEYNLPAYMLNRRGDMLDGTNKHFIMNDLIFNINQDIEREKRCFSWRGYRHAFGQKVRGQRTRNTGRTGMAVGVLRKAIMQQAAAAKAGEAGGAKGAAAGGAGAAGAAAAPKAAAPAAGAPATKKPAAGEKK